MFEFLIYIIIYGNSIATFQASKDLTREDYDKRLCRQTKTQCGVTQNPYVPVDSIYCGDCEDTGPWDLCDGAPPSVDGKNQLGRVNTCGGGCTAVSSFICENGTAVMCSVSLTPPGASM